MLLNVDMKGIGQKSDTIIGKIKLEIHLFNIDGLLQDNIIQEQLMHEINEDRCFITECQKLSHKFLDSGIANQRESKLWFESI